MVLSLGSVDEILKSDHSKKRCQATLNCGAVSYAVQSCSIFESVDKITKYDHSKENC